MITYPRNSNRRIFSFDVVHFGRYILKFFFFFLDEKRVSKENCNVVSNRKITEEFHKQKKCMKIFPNLQIVLKNMRRKL